MSYFGEAVRKARDPERHEAIAASRQICPVGHVEQQPSQRTSDHVADGEGIAARAKAGAAAAANASEVGHLAVNFARRAVELIGSAPYRS